MKVTRVFWSPRSRAVDLSEDVRLGSGFVPTRGASLKALKEVRDLPFESWTVPSMLGWFIERYEERHKRHWPFTSDQTKRELGDVRTLVERVGMEEAHAAIRLVFSPKFKWVTYPAMFLAKKDTYGNFIVPAITEEKDTQEQAQFTGNREGPSREVGADFWKM